MSDQKFKVETIEEFLARGGVIQKIPPKEELEKAAIARETVRSTVSKPPTIHSLDDGALFFSEKTKRKRKQKKIDLSKLAMGNLPDDIRKMMENLGDGQPEQPK